jgi:hypothetical protein
MATALQVQTLGPAPAIADDCSHWLEQTATPREEAMNLFALVGKNGGTVDSIRELIEVPPDIERALRLYIRWHPEDAYGVERVLRFRKRVGEQFERLSAVRQISPCAPVSVGEQNQIESNTTIGAKDAIESRPDEATSSSDLLHELPDAWT